MAQNFDKEKLNEIKKHLKALPKIEQPEVFNPIEALNFLKKELIRLHKKGYSPKEIVKHLKSAGLLVAVSRVKNYLAIEEPVKLMEQPFVQNNLLENIAANLRKNEDEKNDS